jgi:LacI family transcriptional regulator
MAVGALAALRDAGVSVPDEMAIAGFGDLPVSRYITPALSSVRVPALELGSLAVDRMLLAVARRDRPIATHDLLECTVVPRASCGVHESG